VEHYHRLPLIIVRGKLPSRKGVNLLEMSHLVDPLGEQITDPRVLGLIEAPAYEASEIHRLDGMKMNVLERC